MLAMKNSNTSPSVIVIGAANADITGIASDKFTEYESNLGELSLSAGGVGRNIAENLARLISTQNVKTYLLSAIGDDLYGQMIWHESQAAGIDLSHCQKLNRHKTATYLSIIDEQGEMRGAINDMSIVEQINVDYLTTKSELISHAQLIILDANLQQSAIDYICQTFAHIPIFADTVSSVKAQKLASNFKHIHSLAPNLNEAELLSGISVKHQDDLVKVAEYFINKGIQNLYITLGEEGVFSACVKNGRMSHMHLPAMQGKLVNANGAGDAFLAGIAYAWLQKPNPNDQIQYGQACAHFAMASKSTVNPQLSHIKISEYLETL